MQVTCPNNHEHKRFVTVAYVSEDLIVDETGEFLEISPVQDTQVLREPESGNTWSCAECGADALVG